MHDEDVRTWSRADDSVVDDAELLSAIASTLTPQDHFRVDLVGDVERAELASYSTRMQRLHERKHAKHHTDCQFTDDDGI